MDTHISKRITAPRRVTALLCALCLLATTVVSIGFSTGAAAAPGDITVVYDDAIAEPFQNWSWADVDLESTTEVRSGSVAAAVDFDAWEGFYLSAPDGLDLPLFSAIEFSVHGGSAAPAPLTVQILDTNQSPGPAFTIDPQPGGWVDHSFSLADAGGITRIGGLWFQDSSGATRSTIHIDDVRFVELPEPPPAGGPALTVDTGARTITRTVVDPASGQSSNVTVEFPHDISDDIYGMNFAPDSLRAELDIPVNRWGGNSTERYNHTIPGSNLGNDWYFMNAPDDEPDTDHAYESANQATGSDTIMTIPLSGWVAKDGNAGCSYPQGNGTTYDDYQPHWLDQSLMCGNGRVGGELAGSADPTLTSVAVDESFAANWVSELVATHGNAASGGVEIYALGNEPGLWHSTHGDIRPTPIGRDEIVDRNATYSAAIKGADPTAEVIGPVLWSGYSYFVTSEELLINGQFPGDVPTFVGDYLGQMSDRSDAAGVRLLDKLAVNFYDDRVYGGGDDALRLESTRNLWDPTYSPADWWVTRDFLNGDGNAVIPRMNAAIAENYPGTGLAITEYNFGGNDRVAGALAQADALGIFGRENLDLATIWDPYADWTGLTVEEYNARPVIEAFRLYRNYDGNGSKFGDVSLYASSTDEATLAIHAAERSSDGALTLMVINKGTTAMASTIDLAGVTGTAETFTYSAANLTSIEPGADLSVNGSVSTTFPGRSATLLVIDGDTVVEPEPEPTLTCAGIDPENAPGYTVFVGTDGDDTIRGTTGNDLILGLDGNDTIIGRAGDDVVCGGEGDDNLRPGAGDDIAEGGPGIDTIRGGSGNDVLDGGDGDDALVSGNRGMDIVRGGPGNDRLIGGPDDDQLFGGDGDDRISGGFATDSIDGGAGDDWCNGGPDYDDPADATNCERIVRFD